MDREPILVFASFMIGFFLGMYLVRSGIIGGVTAGRKVVYGVRYSYDEKGNLKEVLPVPVPEVG